jgi:hypothetical protein
MSPSGGHVFDSDGEPIVTEPCRGCATDVRIRRDTLASMLKKDTPVLCDSCEAVRYLICDPDGPEWGGDDAMEKR